METIKVNMTPCEDVQTIHASQNDNEGREWGFILHNNGDVIESSEITDQIVFKAYEGGTEELLPSGLLNGSVDLGSLTWRVYNGKFTTVVSDPIPYRAISGQCELFCSKYKTGVYGGSGSQGDGKIWLTASSSSNTLYVEDSSYSDADTFKEAMNGVMLWYRSTDSAPTTTPFLGDIKYPQGLLMNQQFTYRESPTEEDGLANVVGIKGQTIKWNQLVQNGNFASTNGWTVYQPANASINANSNVLTETLTISTLTQGAAYTIGLQKTNVISDATHKYLCFVTITLSFTSNVRIELGGSAVITTNPINANTKTTLSVVSTAFTYNKNLLIYPQSGVVGIDLSEQTLKYENIMIIDLTLMFGAGNEPSTVEEFTSLFPLSYYAYNQGTLLSFMSNGIKTVGFNQWDEQTQKGYRNGSNGNYVSNQSQLCSLSYIPVLPNTDYCYRKTLNIGDVIFYDANKVFISSLVNMRTNAVFTTPSNCHFININLGSTYGNVYKNDICINISDPSKNGTYEPYTSSLAELPISQYFPNGMDGVGTDYDELTNTKATTRMTRVDLGSLDWNYNPTYGMYSTGISNSVKKPSASSVRANAISTIGTFTDWATFYASGTTSGLLAINTSGYIGIATTETNSTTFKNSLQGVYLVYPLATPTEVTFSTASLVTENAEIPLSNEDGTLIGKCTEQLSENPGFFDAKIKLADADGECYSNKIQLHVERSPQ